MVDLADSIAYDAHDVDDAIKLNLLQIRQLRQVPLVEQCLDWIHHTFGHCDAEQLRRALVHTLIDCQVNDVLKDARQKLENWNSDDAIPRIELSSTVAQQKKQLELFLYQNVYRHPQILEIRLDAQKSLQNMFHRLSESPELMPKPYQCRAAAVGVRLAVRDYLAGMTDNFCLSCYKKMFAPPSTRLNIQNPV